MKLLLIKPKLGDSLKQAVHDVLQVPVCAALSFLRKAVGNVLRCQNFW